jgi:hypothetical protein
MFFMRYKTGRRFIKVKASEHMIFREHNKMYCLTRFGVYEDYVFEGDWENKKGCFKAKGDIKYTYNPLSEEHDILTPIANLDVNNLDELLQFVRNFGLFGEESKRLNLREMQYITKFPHQFSFKKENIFHIFSDILALRETFFYANKSINKDVNKNDEIWAIKKLALLNKHVEENTNLPEYIKVEPKEDETSALMEVTALLLRQNASYIESTQVINGDYAPAIIFPSLIDVAYYQLSKALLEQKEFRRCLRHDCNKLFIAQHGHQKFCAPLPGKKRSKCENTYNQRLKRQRQKEKQ